MVMFYAEVIAVVSFRMRILGEKGLKSHFKSALTEALELHFRAENLKFIRKEAGFFEMRNGFAFNESLIS